MSNMITRRQSTLLQYLRLEGIALCLLLLATGASAEPVLLERFISSGPRYDDVERGVTCWLTGMGFGISCLPMQVRQAGNERQLSQHETQPEPTPALAPGRWIDERYEL